MLNMTSSQLRWATVDHNRHGPKIRGLCTFFLVGELGRHLTQCRLGRGLPPYTKWYPYASSPLATIDMGRKLGVVPLFGEAGSPSNTKSPGSRPTSIPSGILIHKAVWPQRTWAKNWWGLCPLYEEALLVPM